MVLGWPALVRRNAADPYDAELGALAESSTTATSSTIVIGNADGTDELGVRPADRDPAPGRPGPGRRATASSPAAGSAPTCSPRTRRRLTACASTPTGCVTAFEEELGPRPATAVP